MENERLNEIHSYLTKNINRTDFGMRDGYIFSGITKKIFFDLFISPDVVGLKYPKGNISESKISLLSNLINEINPGFVYREYNTTPKTKYSIWELNIVDFEVKEIADLLLRIQKDHW